MADQYNIDLATRQAQINEWAYNNKMDTLFVFQILFMTVLFASILMALKTSGIVGGLFVWYSMIIVIAIVVIIIINRAVYTNKRRDNQMWNKRRFDDDNHKDSPLRVGDTSYQSYMDVVQKKYGGTTITKSCSCKK